MSIDASKVVHICPLCDQEFTTHDRVCRHVTKTQDEQHKGINGFEMDMTIVTDTKDVWDVESEQELHNKIIRSSEYFDDISEDNVQEIADKAEVPSTRVFRVFEDEDIQYSLDTMKPKTHVEELTEMQYATLCEWKGKSETRSYKYIAEKVNKKNQDIDMSRAYPQLVIRDYGWMKLPIYDSSEFDDSNRYDGDITVEDSTDDMIANANKHLQSTNSDDDTEEMNDQSDSDDITQEDVYEAFLDSDVAFKVVPDEDEFDVMSKLIKSGHDDVARHIFN